MENGQVNIINQIIDYKYIKREWLANNGKDNYLYKDSDEFSPYRLDALLIFYSSQKEYVELCIYWNIHSNTKILGLHWENFNKTLINELATKFKLEIKINRDGNQYLRVKNLDYSLKIAIRRSIKTNSYFIAIYYFDDGESRRNPQLYVHGIWEVELSKEFEKIFFE